MASFGLISLVGDMTGMFAVAGPGATRQTAGSTQGKAEMAASRGIVMSPVNARPPQGNVLRSVETQTMSRAMRQMIGASPEQIRRMMKRQVSQPAAIVQGVA